MKHLLRPVVFLAAIFVGLVFDSCRNPYGEYGDGYTAIPGTEWEYDDNKVGAVYYFKFEDDQYIGDRGPWDFTYKEYYFQSGSRPQYEVVVTGTYTKDNGRAYFSPKNVTCTAPAYTPSLSSFPTLVWYISSKYIKFNGKQFYRLQRN